MALTFANRVEKLEEAAQRRRACYIYTLYKADDGAPDEPLPADAGKYSRVVHRHYILHVPDERPPLLLAPPTPAEPPANSPAWDAEALAIELDQAREHINVDLWNEE
jgi:hypothetical protein